jgi:ribosome-binding protein aMBF1 (putative translation factor)
MTTKNNNISEILGNAKTSKWLDSAIQWKKNAAWLRHSQNIALDILERLDELNWNQKVLAKKLEVSPQIVSRWLKGNENFSLETISKLETVLSLQLIGREGKKEKKEMREG